MENDIEQPEEPCTFHKELPETRLEMDIGQPGDPSTPPSASKFMQIGIAPTVDAEI